MKISKKTLYILVVLFLLIGPFAAQVLFAQPPPPPPPPPPPVGAPIDGLSGILLMAGAAFFGKKFLKKDKE